MKTQVVTIKPVDDVGLQKDRPEDEVRYTRLYNCTFEKGVLKQRPAIRLLRSEEVVASGPATSISETTARREDLLYERLYPDADGADTDWATTGANYHSVLVEGLDNNYISTDTVGDKAGVTFPNLAETYTAINRVIINLAMWFGDYDDQLGKLKVSVKFGGAGAIEVGEIEMWGDSEESMWKNYYVVLNGHPQSGKPMTEAQVNSITVILEYSYNKWSLILEKKVVADGADGDWAKPGGNQDDMYLEVDEYAYLDDEDTTTLVTATPGQQISFVLDTGFDTAYETIDRAALGISVKTLSKVARYQMYVIDSGAYYNWGPELVVYPSDTNYASGYIWLTINPVTDAAFSDPAELDGMKVGVRYVSGPAGENAVLTALSMRADGWKVPASLKDMFVTELYMGVEGYYTEEEEYAHLETVGGGQLRYDQSSGMQDVSGSVAAPTAPPAEKVDWCDFEGQLYFVNGVDQTIRYPDASLEFEVVSAGKPVGRTIESFADRIILGDIYESGQRVRDQVRWCKFRDPTNWDHVTSGAMRLRQTPGALVKIKNLLSYCVAYKEKGIYNMIHRSDPNSPLYAIIKDPETGNIAKATTQAISIGGEVAAHIFLGQNLMGYNVFTYNGEVASPVGQPIVDMLEDEHTPQQLRHSFGVVDPQRGLYLLFIPEGTQHYPEQCYVYDIQLGLWTGRWHFPFPITCAGIWHISIASGGRSQLRYPMIVLGTLNTLPYVLRSDELNDHAVEGWNDIPILQIMETGDLALAKSELHAKTFEFWTSSIDEGPVAVKIELSQDGAKSWLDEYNHVLGSLLGAGELRVDALNVNLDAQRRVRFKLSNESLDQQIQLTGFGVEAAEGGKR